MLRAALAFLICMLWAGAASPGPWPLARDEGHLSLGLEAGAEHGDDLYATLFAETGIGGGRVLGFDLGQSEDRLDKAVLFLRRPFGAGSEDAPLAWEIGIGIVDDAAALRAGVSAGRSVDLAGRPGWIAIDTRAALFGADGTGRLEIDLTLGAGTGRGDKWLVQVQMAAPSDHAPYARIAPAWAFRTGPGRHLLFGVTAGVANNSDAKLSVGLWQRF